MESLRAKDRVLELARQMRVLRPRDVQAIGIPGNVVARLAQKGFLVRIDRGLYTVPNVSTGEHYSLAEAAKRVPRGIVCLLSALSFHQLTTQSPFEVWMAIADKDRRPKLDGVAIRIVRYSGEALTAGVETHVIDGVEVRVFAPAKTVADCFKYRNKIGIDVAIESLRDCHTRRSCSVNDLVRYARVCRVARVMQPYMEAIVGS